MALHPSSTSVYFEALTVKGKTEPHVFPNLDPGLTPTDTFADTQTTLALGVAAGAVTLAMIPRWFTARRSKLTTDLRESNEERR
jgi:hypothetical protein